MPQSTTIELKTTFAFQAKPVPYEYNTLTGILIRVQSDCLAQSSKLASDVAAALDYGAFPAAHAVMLDRIHTAEKEGKPLVCSMECNL